MKGPVVKRREESTMPCVASSKIEFLEPWYEFIPGQADVFLTELRRELSLGHPLEGLELAPLGHSGAADDALFEVEDGRVVQVHLTFSRRIEQTHYLAARSTQMRTSGSDR